MTEQNNIALIRNFYAAYARGDIKTILDHVTAETEWTFEGPSNIPFTGTRKGTAQILGFFHGLDSSTTGVKLSPRYLIAQDDAVAMFGRFSGKSKTTGARFDVPISHYFRVRVGKVIEYINLLDTAALSAALGTFAPPEVGRPHK